MAETTEIINLTINLDQAVKDTASYKDRVDSLKSSLDALKKSEDATTEQIVLANSEYKAANKQLQDNEKVLTQLTTANKEEAGTLEKLTARNNELRLERQKLNTNTKEGQSRLKEINGELDKNTAYIKENSDKQKQQTLNVGNYKESLSGATGVLGNMSPALGSASSSVTAFGNAFKFAMGWIGLLIAGGAALISYFKRSEEGQNNLTKIVAVFNVVLQNVLDIVGKVGEAIFNAVSKPKEAWESLKTVVSGFVDFFKNTFGNVIGGYVDIWVGGLTSAFENVGLAWQKFKGVFVDNTEKIATAQGNVDAANKKVSDGIDRIKQGAINMKDAVVGAYDAATNAIKGFIDESKKEIDRTTQLENQKAALRKKEREEIVSIAQIEKEVAELRANIAQKDKFSGSERLKMLSEVESLMNKQMEMELSNARQKADIHAAEIDMSDSTIDDLDEQAKLEADIIKIQTANAEKRRSLERQRITAISDQQAEMKKAADESIKLLELELKKFESTNSDKYSSAQFLTQNLVDEEKKRQEEISNLERSIIEKRYADGLSSQAEYDNALFDLDVSSKEAQRAIDQEWSDIKMQDSLTAAQLQYDAELGLMQDNIFAQLELERARIAEQEAMELESIEMLAISEEQKAALSLKVSEKYAKADLAIDKAKTNAKMSLASGFADNIAQIAGENTVVAKTAAATAATINTFQAATGAFAALAPIPIVGPVLGIAAAAAAAAAGFANVKKIFATKSGLPGDTGAGSVGGGDVATATAPVVPSLPTASSPTIGQGIVSRATSDGGTSAIKQGFAEALSEAPTRTAVVIDDVTAAQTISSNNNQAAII